MTKCDKCHENEGKHTYGRFKLCDNCRDFVEKEWRSKNKTPEIEIRRETGFNKRGGYISGEGRIKFSGGGLDEFERVLNHEVMHHVLNFFISTQASFCYDNVCGKVDCYHG